MLLQCPGACSSNSEEKSFAKDIISKVVRNSKDTDWKEYNLIQMFQFIIVTMEALYNMQKTYQLWDLETKSEGAVADICSVNLAPFHYQKAR